MISLISLPMGDLTAPPLGIAQIKGYLSKEGAKHVKLFDSGLDFFYDCIQEEKLNEGYNQIKQFLAEKDSCEREPDKYRYFFECGADAEYTKNNVANAIKNLKQKNAYTNWEYYRQNVSIIEHALKLFSIPYFPTVVAYQKIVFPGSEYCYSDVTALATDRKHNPLYSFFERNILKYISDKTNYVGISINYSQQLVGAFSLANVIKEYNKNIKIVAGGSLFSSFRNEPEKYDLLIDYFDAVIPDAGEEVWSGIIRNGGLENIPGCWVRRKNHFVNADGEGKMVVRKCPDFDGFNLEKYLTAERVLPYAISSGCYWGKCTFCSYHAYKSQCVKKKPYGILHKIIIEDLKQLKEKYNADYFFFVDEAIPPIVAQHLAQEIQENHYGFHWFGEMRFERIINNDDFAQYLKAGGCDLILWGLESGNDRVLKMMQKGTTRTLIQEILQTYRAAQIRSMPMFFVGFPTETEQEARDTINLLKKNVKNIQSLGAGTFMLLKGCPVHQNPSKFSIQIKPAKSLLSYFDHFEPQSGMDEQQAEALLNEIYLDTDLSIYFYNRVLSWNHLIQLPIEMDMKEIHEKFLGEQILSLALDCTIFTTQYNWFQNVFDAEQHCYIYNTTKEKIYEISKNVRDVIMAFDGVMRYKDIIKQHELDKTIEFLLREEVLVAHSLLRRRRKLGIQCQVENNEMKVLKVCKSESNLKPGDIIQKIESLKVDDINALQKIMRQNSLKESVTIDVIRRKQKIKIQEFLIETPSEQEDGVITQYSEVKYENNYYRTIWTRKCQTTDPRKVIVFIQGIECSSIDFQEQPNDVYRKLVYGMSRDVFSVVRLELFGNGDSQGGDCSEYSFFEITGLYKQLVKQLCENGYSVYLWGYSIGGIISSYIAKEMPDRVKGIVIFDTIYPDLFTYLLKNQLRQQRLQGLSIENIKENAREYEAFLSKLLEEKLTAYQVVEQNPRFAKYFDSEYKFLGHVYQYAQEIYEIDFEECLQAISLPVILLVGREDYLIDFDAHKDMYDKLRDRKKVKFVELQVNHWFESHGLFSEQALQEVINIMLKIFC